MKYILLLIAILGILNTHSALSKELKPKKGFKVPEGAAYVATIDINMDKVRDYVVQDPNKISIYNGKDGKILYIVPLDSKSDESFFMDNSSTGGFKREDLLKDLNRNGSLDIPIRGLDLTGSSYIKIVDPKNQEKIVETRYSMTSDNIYIYDVDGNDTLDVIIERLDSVLIFSTLIEIPQSVNSTRPTLLASLHSYPNPSYGNCTIIWKRIGNNDNEQSVAVIINTNGQEVRSLLSEMNNNQSKFEWDGKANDNTPVPDGMYFVKVRTKELATNTSIVVAR